MANPETLKDLYVEELRDLWSANDQMQRILPKLSKEAGDKLSEMLDAAVGGIKQHTEAIKGLLQASGGKTSKDHCKGMEGLVEEAKKHAIDEEIEDQDVRDAVILSQYQRMCHYGISGFGTAAAYAKALGLNDDEQALKKTVSEIYQGDRAATQLAKTAVNLAARQDQAA